MYRSASSKLKGVVRGTYARIDSNRYHRRSNQKALGVLATIGKAQGRLPQERVDECNRYAIETLGDRKYAPWLYVYSAVSGVFRFGWIPDNFYGSIVVPRLKGAYGQAADLTGLQTKLFGQAFFPDLFYSINGLVVDLDNRVIDPVAVIGKYLESNDRIVFKRDSSRQGRGIVIIGRADLNRVNFEDLGNGVFQEYISQHPFLETFHPHSVATLRMTTAVDRTGTVSLRASYLRFGSGGDTHVMSGSHIRVPVDRSSGALDANGFTVENSVFYEHLFPLERS